MEPENKKEIMLAWWKFVGFQFAIVVIVSLSFFSAKFYPDEVKKDYLNKSKKWKVTKSKYIQASKQIDELSFLMQKFIDGKIAESEISRIKLLSSDITRKYEEASTKRPFVLMPYHYQDICLKYIDKDAALKSAGGCPQELEKVKQERDRFEDKKDEIQKQFDDYKVSHPD